MTARLVIVGGGRMGEALLGGLLKAEWCDSNELVVVETNETRRKELERLFPGVEVVAEAVPAEAAVIAVKPNDVEAACRLVAPLVERVLSIAAGIPTPTIEAWLERELPVVRAMPNTAALVGAGAAAISVGAHATEEDLAWAERLLLSVSGTVQRVPESLLDAVTGLSGSGPAYVFLMAEALIDAGVAVGLPRDASVALTVQTSLGAARLLAESGDPPEALRAQVTSPGGTTAAGLSALERRAVRAAFLEAVQAATARSRELGS